MNRNGDWWHAFWQNSACPLSFTWQVILCWRGMSIVFKILKVKSPPGLSTWLKPATVKFHLHSSYSSLPFAGNSLKSSKKKLGKKKRKGVFTCESTCSLLHYGYYLTFYHLNHVHYCWNSPITFFLVAVDIFSFITKQTYYYFARLALIY